jgi:hypothetical protein
MKQYLLFQVLLTLIICSCHSTNTKEAYLTNDSCKYWFRYYKNPLKPYALGYRICKDGTYQYYYKNDSSERILINSPVLPKSIWRFINDTTMEYGKGRIVKIEFLNSDSLILLDTNFPLDDPLRLHRDNDQTTRPIPKAIKDTIGYNEPTE